jgi:hypothetical protein
MPFTVMRPSLVGPPRALKKVMVGVAATPLPSTVMPGVAFSSEPTVRVAGIAAITSWLTTTSRRVFCTSTTGASPVTVIVSWSAPTLSSIGIVIVTLPDRARSVRCTVLNPGSDAVSEYVPGGRSMMRYCPDPSVTAVRVFSVNAGLEASTVTPGSTAPDASFTVPDNCAPPAWANASAGASRSRNARVTRDFAETRILTSLLRPLRGARRIGRAGTWTLAECGSRTEW